MKVCQRSNVEEKKFWSAFDCLESENFLNQRDRIQSGIEVYNKWSTF